MWGFQPDEIRRSDHSTIVHQHLDWGDVRADMVKRTGLLRQETRIAVKDHTFLINLQGEARSGEDYLDGRRVAFTPRKAGSIVFLPVDSEWNGWDEGDATGSYLFVSMDANFVHQTLGTEYLTGLHPAIGFRDSVIETSLHRIATELKSPDPTSVIMVESQAVQILVQMIRLAGLRLEPNKGGLSPYDLKRVIALMEARLVDPPTADELARKIGVSRRHFFRAFKQSVGKTPYAYMADLRLKKALDLLRATDRSATEIALECGFASSSHFAYAFRRVHGAGPSEYRRRWRS
jgi:AraC-like DNA-binding protein